MHNALHSASGGELGHDDNEEKQSESVKSESLIHGYNPFVMCPFHSLLPKLYAADGALNNEEHKLSS